jgi:hypothetical protein
MSGKVKLTGIFEKHFPRINEYKVVFICDDSGSMAEELSYRKGCSRWNELKETLTDLLDLLFTKCGKQPEVYFLNNCDERKNFTYNGTKEQITANFAIKPHGGTPLKKIFKEVRENPLNQNKKLVIIIFTDGIPTESGVAESIAIENFKKELQKIEGTQTYVSIVACTDKSATVAYLNGWDQLIKNLDVNDDYKHENQFVQKANCASLPVVFTYSDYIGKIL